MAVTWMKYYGPTVSEREKIDNTLVYVRKRIEMNWRLRRASQRAARQARTEAGRELHEDEANDYTNYLYDLFDIRRRLLGRCK